MIVLGSLIAENHGGAGLCCATAGAKESSVKAKIYEACQCLGASYIEYLIITSKKLYKEKTM